MTRVSFTARANAATSARTDCAVLPVFGKTLSAAAKQFDDASDGAITAALALGDFDGKSGKTLMLPGIDGARRVLLAGCGDAGRFKLARAREFAQALYHALNNSSAKDATIHCAELSPTDADLPEFLELMSRAITTLAYRYTETVSKPKHALAATRLVVVCGKGRGGKTAQAALDSGSATGNGVNAARNLANLPGNICTPSYLARHARKLARGNAKLTAKVLEEKKMAELGMGALLSVSAGSDEAAKLIVLEYQGTKTGEQPYVLVGKGITFDSGGISIKPGAKMDEMKFDMGGAAGVLGTMHAVSELGLPLNVVAIIAAAENMPSGGATRPGDVVTSMAGITIEVLNTDAEGRMVLCDALTYAMRYDPKAVIDVATLTGACVVALGSHAAALYANNDELAEQLLSAGTQAHDRAWRMPLWDEYRKQLSTPFADMANVGGPAAGSITAACFLARFTESYPWAHLDIAGAAWDSSPKGATGRPVSMLTRYLQQRC